MKKTQIYRKEFEEFNEHCIKTKKNPSYEDMILEVLMDIHEMLYKKFVKQEDGEKK